jgi:dTDP-4-amino-4,6-dideoxygalactose transaminase
MAAVREICAPRGIPIVEDAAQAIGARYRSQGAGTMGAFGCFSFYPTKNLGGFGDGGMIVTGDDAHATRLVRLRAHGAHPKYRHAMVGTNSRLDALQAALLSVKLPHLERWAARRRENAAYYQRRFADTAIRTPFEHPDCHHVYNQFVIRVPERDRMVDGLKKAGIGTEIYYPVPLHLQECFGHLGYREGDLPVSEAAARESLAIPIHPDLTTAQLERVADAVLGLM